MISWRQDNAGTPPRARIWSPRMSTALIIVGVPVQLAAILFLPRTSLLTAVPVTVLIAAMLFVAELIRSGSDRLHLVAVALWVSSVALAASTGPGLAGLVTLAAASPALFLTAQPLATGHRLIMDTATSMVAAILIWTIDHGGVIDRDDRPVWATVCLHSAITLIVVLGTRWLPGAAARDWRLSALDAGALIAPFTFATVALNTILSPNRTVLTTAILATIPICLAVIAHVVGVRRQNPVRAVETLVTALDHRHPETSAHSARVYSLVSRMLDDVPGLRPAEREAILTASLIHDIGKVGTPDGALLKPSALTSTERDIMRQHVAIGEEIVRRLDGLEATAPIVRHHHERWDGAGYPDGLTGPGIPFGARLIAVADTYDAMTHDRVYRRALGHHEALAELRQQRGRQFDPVVVDIFSRIISDEAMSRAAPSSRVAS
jgi:putative nucleotidyltransferase with HDIG domain